jgi:hypothetical protein
MRWRCIDSIFNLFRFDCSQSFNKLVLWCKEQCNTHDDNLQQANEVPNIHVAGDHFLDINNDQV